MTPVEIIEASVTPKNGLWRKTLRNPVVEIAAKIQSIRRSEGRASAASGSTKNQWFSCARVVRQNHAKA